MQRRPHDKYFDRALRKIIFKMARKYYWRVASHMDLDDLIQEGFLAYVICKERYRHKVKNQRHFCGLVTMVFMNRIHDLATERTRSETTPVSKQALKLFPEIKNDPQISRRAWACPPKAQRIETEEPMEPYEGIDFGDAELAATLASAPAEVKAFLNLFNSPQGLAELDKPLRRRLGGQRETTSERLSLILGMPVDDMELALRNLLEGKA